MKFIDLQYIIVVIKYILKQLTISTDTHALAEDAAELVDVDYEPLPAVVDYADGRGRRRARAREPRLQRHRRDRRPARRRRSTTCSTPAAHVVERDDLTSRRTRRCRWRGAASSSTTRRATGELTIYAATQAPHEVRLFCSRLLGMPEHRIRVVDRATPAAASARRSWCSATRCA